VTLFSKKRPRCRKKLLFWALVCLFFWTGTAATETSKTDFVPSLTASIDKNTVRIGDLVWVTLRYGIPEDAALFGSNAVGGLEQLTVIENITEPDQIKIRFLVDQLESFDLGPFSLTYIDGQNQTREVTTNPLAITVVSNLGEKAEGTALKPIEGIIATRSRALSYLLWASVVLLLLGIASGLVYWRKRRDIRDLEAILEDPPHVKADREIDTLIASGLFERGDVKAFYYIFSETIRRYMESIRLFPAAEMTTEEIARAVQANPLDQCILPLLKQADLVKFADSVPAPERKDQDILAARTYIRQTRPATEELQSPPSRQEVSP
jgi:hypothetical protein